jgi:hypothetical protein
MANQFSVAVPSLYEALLAGESGYKGMRDMQSQRAMQDARREAESALAGGGDTRSAMARLLGAGDVQGATALAQFGNQDFERQYKTRHLDLLERNANKRDVPAGFQASPTGGLEPIKGGPADPTYKRTVGDRQNAPAGYKWNDPNDPNAGLTPIAGGPAEKVDAEVAARIGLGRSFLGQLPAIRKSVEEGQATGAFDFAVGKTGYGRSGEVHRQIASGAEALLRNLTGAGMNKDEAAEYVNRYRPSWKDNAETLLSKMNQLERELLSVMETVGRGRGGMPGIPGAAPGPGAAPAPKAAAPAGQISEGRTATHPLTGAKIRFQGGQWVPVQ